MPDAYADLRALHLRHVLLWLGVDSNWKERKGGTEFYGRCPLHEAKKNTTSFSFDSTGRFNCFSCGKKGRGSIDLVMAIKGLGFSEAAKLLQSGLGNIIAQQAAKPQIKQLQEVLGKPEDLPTENPPFKSTYDKYAVESSWLKERGFTPETLARYEVFEYNNPARKSIYSGSVMLKIRRYSDGECVGYLSRNIGEVTPEKPKYVFPKGVSKSLELFGAWQIKNDGQRLPLRFVYVVESPLCVLKFHQLGFAAVSPFGWSVSEQQVAILKQLAKGIVFLPDRNKHAEALAVAGAIASSLWVKAPELPDGVDDPEQLALESILQMT